MVETFVLVTDYNLDVWVAVVAVVIDEACQVRLAERELPPSLGSQPDALSAANGCQPSAELAWVSELVEVFQAA